MPIHRHQKTKKTIVILRGRLVAEYYDELERGCTEAIELKSGAGGGIVHTGGTMAHTPCLGKRDGDTGDEGWAVQTHRAGGYVGGVRSIMFRERC